MGTGLICTFVFIALTVGLLIINRYNVKQEQKKLYSLPADDELVFMDFRGFKLPMTRLEKKELWDNMTYMQRVGQVKKVKQRLKNGSLIAVYTRERNVVYVTKALYEKGNYEIAGKEYYNTEHGLKTKKV